MSNASKASAAFGVYILIGGTGLFLIPNTLLSLVGMPPTNDMWVRMFGAVIAILGLYYIQAARDNNVAFIRMSLWGRTLVFVSFVSLALAQFAAPIIILIGLIDFGCALGTGWILRQDSKRMK